MTHNNEDVFKQCDIVFLGVKPGMLQEALRGVGDTLLRRLHDNPDLLVISMLAGINLDSLRKVSEKSEIKKKQLILMFRQT